MLNLEQSLITLDEPKLAVRATAHVSHRGIYFTPKISLGEVIMVVLILMMALWAVSRVAATTQTRHDLSVFEAMVDVQLKDLKSTVDSRFYEQRAQLLAMPTVTAIRPLDDVAPARPVAPAVPAAPAKHAR